MVTSLFFLGRFTFRNLIPRVIWMIGGQIVLVPLVLLPLGVLFDFYWGY